MNNSQQLEAVAAPPVEPVVKNGLEKYFGKMDPVIFWTTGAIIVAAVIFGIIAPAQFDGMLSRFQKFITGFSWYFILSVAIYLGVCVYVAFSKYGDLKLGKPGEKPQFSYFSWIAMLFSCGVGVGYAFWAVGEPIMHYMNTPYLAEPQTAEAMPVAIQIGVMHWGLHAWAIFALVGLAIAFPAYRMGKPMNVSISLYGLFGDKITGSFFGRFVEFLAAFATVAGVSTALGLGIISINAGIKHIFGTGLDTFGMVVFMIFLIACYILSAVSGIEKGIKNLSNINVYVAFIWGGFILLMGPTNDLLNLMVQTTGSYINNFVYVTFWTDFHDKTPWLGWWTVFYWIWWISWGPFCGGFVARISRGRTIREFILGVALVPTLVALVWFSVVGGAAQYAQINGTAPMAEALKADMGSGIYVLLSSFPGGDIMGWIVFINLLIFLITSADSASFFVAMQMARGSMEPGTMMKLIWGGLIGSLALVLLITGGLQALQKAAIIAGAPFSIIIFMMIFSLLKMLRQAYNEQE
ncbi:BCCT family transporter [Desulforhopalus singaporensis]|uniref:Glycine betaine transporter n=1 Tax=Desulforhopalus singaporensis TaxID=91360 RepID=A0A1H0IZN6_9BACT|nr:BCCT family transporter [Desulforhopalus singaporensis]SDO36649.1 glycine betaine transporter [Desulforhopalus singaporensis]